MNFDEKDNGWGTDSELLDDDSSQFLQPNIHTSVSLEEKKNERGHIHSELEQWSGPPPQISQTIENLPATQRPNRYRMFHLLPDGSRGTQYQLMVMLERLIILQSDSSIHDFVATMERDNFGNLDDIELAIKDDKGAVVSLEVYQVKYYKYPITIYDFLNQPKEQKKNSKKQNEDSNNNPKKKNEKMQIGKSFEGWLRWKEKNRDLKDEKLSIVIYTNTYLDSFLNQCITDGRFRSEFIDHKDDESKVFISRTPESVSKVKFKKLIGGRINEQGKQRIWQELINEGYLYQKKKDGPCYFATRFNATPVFKLSLPKITLPKSITEREIQQCLEEIYKDHSENQNEDLYEILYQQAMEYLQNSGDTLLNLSDEEKTSLFRRFLKCFHFQANQSKLPELQERIQKLLIPEGDSPDIIFTCLFYAIYEWFLKEYPGQTADEITKPVMQGLIKDSVARSEMVHFLRGRTDATFSNIFYGCGSSDAHSVSRGESDILMQELKATDHSNRKVILVVGESGTGKSGLVKKILLENCHPAEYLAFVATDLIQKKELQVKLKEVVPRIKTIRFVVIDGIEKAFSPDFQLQELFIFLMQSVKSPVRLILTLTPVVSQHKIFQKDSITVTVNPLSSQNIIQTFPELVGRGYQTIEPLMNMAVIPFYLSAIVGFINQMTKEEFSYQITTHNTNIKSMLVKLMIKGQDKDEQNFSKRCMAWQRLAVEIMRSSTRLNTPVPLIKLPGVPLLLKDRIIVEQDNTCFFSHDLFLEHGIIAFWQQKWETSVAEGENSAFWRSLSTFLFSYPAKNIFEKWYGLYKSQLVDDIKLNIETILQLPCSEAVIIASIITNDQIIVRALLETKRIELNKLFVRGLNNSATYIFLALQYNLPEILQLLLNYGAKPHHPDAGELVHQNNLVYYATYAGLMCEPGQRISFAFGVDGPFFDFPKWTIADWGSEIEEIVDRNEKSEFDHTKDNRNEYEQDSLLGIPEYDRNTDYQLYIHQAVIQNRGDFLSILLQHYKEISTVRVIDVVNQWRETALHLGVLKNSFGSVKILLENGAEIDCRDQWGETPLHNAVYECNYKLVDFLLGRKADPNIANEVGLSPLHIALIKLKPDIVELLLRNKASFLIGVGGLYTEDELNRGESDEEVDSEAEQEDKDKSVMVLPVVLSIIYQKNDNKTEIDDFLSDIIKRLNHEWRKKYDKNKHLQAGLEAIATLLIEMIEDSVIALDNPYPPHIDFRKAKLEAMLKNTGDLEPEDEDVFFTLKSYILSDHQRIADVLQCKRLSLIRSALLQQWFKVATPVYYQNLKIYAVNYQDEVVAKFCTEFEQTYINESTFQDSGYRERKYEISSSSSSLEYKESLNKQVDNEEEVKSRKRKGGSSDNDSSTSKKEKLDFDSLQTFSLLSSSSSGSSPFSNNLPLSKGGSLSSPSLSKNLSGLFGKNKSMGQLDYKLLKGRVEYALALRSREEQQVLEAMRRSLSESRSSTSESFYEAAKRAQKYISDQEAKQKALQLSNNRTGGTDRATQLATRAASYGLQYREVDREGNCLYDAIYDQLRTRGLLSVQDQKIVTSHVEVRQRAAHQLLEDFIAHPATTGFVAGSPDEYILKLLQIGTWGDHLELYTLAKAFDVIITVINHDGLDSRGQSRPEIFTPHQFNNQTPIIVLGYLRGVHYLSLHDQAGLEAATKREKLITYVRAKPTSNNNRQEMATSASSGSYSLTH